MPVSQITVHNVNVRWRLLCCLLKVDNIALYYRVQLYKSTWEDTTGIRLMERSLETHDIMIDNNSTVKELSLNVKTHANLQGT